VIQREILFKKVFLTSFFFSFHKRIHLLIHKNEYVKKRDEVLAENSFLLWIVFLRNFLNSFKYKFVWYFLYFQWILITFRVSGKYQSRLKTEKKMSFFKYKLFIQYDFLKHWKNMLYHSNSDSLKNAMFCFEVIFPWFFKR
jgi:hypothetical protein